jgi:orotidine-5'-phosphate decarboxylase
MSDPARGAGPPAGRRPADRLIVALDGLDGDQAMALARDLPGLRRVKVGLELFIREGPAIVRRLRDLGLSVFLDLKLHDIPATMAAASGRAAALGVDLLTLHASAGHEALAASRAAACEAAARADLPPPALLAVTVLTSWNPQRFAAELRIEEPLEAHVARLAAAAAAAGLQGCVCSPLEAAGLRRRHPEPFLLVTPGIRPDPAGSGRPAGEDQVRVTTPSRALAAGASLLVIGRPITRASDPAAAFARCCRDLQGR